jgi:hypothetical protein
MKLYISVFLCFLSFSANASKKAITEEGDIVVLNDNGTWVYEDGKASADVEITINDGVFTKGSESSFTLKSTKTNSSFAINPKEWKFKKSENGHASAEYTFQLKDGDLYGMAISEQVEIDVEALVNIAFENAKGVASDVQIIKKEYRVVNGHKVIYMEMMGTIQSIRFTYLGYYFSNTTGSTQYLAYTGASLVEKYQADIDKFLNGFSLNL